MLPSKHSGLIRCFSFPLSLTKHRQLPQACKEWLLRYVASSSNRVGGLAKYLVALAGSIQEALASAPSKPSAKRRRLHILYLLHDLLHHTKYHLDTNAAFSAVSGSLQPFMVDLLGHAAAYDRQKYPRHHRRLDDLLDIWSAHGYFSPELIHKLREVVENGAAAGDALPSNDVLLDEAETSKKQPGKGAPFIMPSTHGDPATPYYDLPAGNMVPHMIPNSTVPLRAESIKPLQFLAGPADETLVKGLKGFLKDVDQIYGTEELVKDDANLDVDELGQRVARDEITGDILDGETYYGWSRAFCQQMKRKTPDGSRSRSRSRSRARNDLKRRRYSDSSMSHDSRRSGSRSRSRSRPDRREDYQSESGSRPRRRSQSRESPYSPEELPPRHFPPRWQPHQPPPPPTNHNHPPFPPSNPPHNAQYAPPGANFPPAFPPPYTGPWPPAPPPNMPGVAFPPAGPGPTPSAFPPPFVGSASMPLPPGQSHFPPPHSGGQHGVPGGSSGGRKWR